jgi:regulatory protein
LARTKKRSRFGERPRLEQSALRHYALRALARRQHSTGELRKKLEERAAHKPDVETLLLSLTESLWLDDQRFALEFARSRRALHRRYGRFRIAQELRQREIAGDLIEEALDEVFPTVKDEIALLRRRIEKRLERARPPFTQKLVRSLYGSLLRAGFPSAIIRDELFRRPEFQQESDTDPQSAND